MESLSNMDKLEMTETKLLEVLMSAFLRNNLGNISTKF